MYKNTLHIGGDYCYPPFSTTRGVESNLNYATVVLRDTVSTDDADVSKTAVSPKARDRIIKRGMGCKNLSPVGIGFRRHTIAGGFRSKRRRYQRDRSAVINDHYYRAPGPGYRAKRRRKGWPARVFTYTLRVGGGAPVHRLRTEHKEPRRAASTRLARAIWPLGRRFFGRGKIWLLSFLLLLSPVGIYRYRCYCYYPKLMTIIVVVFTCPCREYNGDSTSRRQSIGTDRGGVSFFTIFDHGRGSTFSPENFQGYRGGW